MGIYVWTFGELEARRGLAGPCRTRAGARHPGLASEERRRRRTGRKAKFSVQGGGTQMHSTLSNTHTHARIRPVYFQHTKHGGLERRAKRPV